MNTQDRQKQNSKESKSFLKEINRIPDYDGVFRDSAKTGGKGKGVVFGLIKTRIWQIIAAFFFYILKTLPVYIIPLLTSAVIDEITVGDANVKKLAVYAAIMLVSILQNVPTHVVYARITDGVLRSTGAGIRDTVIRKLQRLSITYHLEIESGKLQSKFMRDTESVDQYLRMIFYSFIPTCISLAINVGITLYKSPIVALFFLVMIPFDVILVRIFRTPIAQSYGMLRRDSENLSAKLTQMLEMLQVTKAHGLENEEIQKLDADIRKATRSGLYADRAVAHFGSWSWVFMQLFNVLCLFFCVYMALKGVAGFTVGAIILYQSLFANINGGVQGIINALPQMASGKEAVRSLSEIMDSDDIEDSRGKRKLSNLKGEVMFDKVYYKYPDKNEYVIKNFCLNVKAGECIAVVGASGSGKSTIMNMIIGFLKPTEGLLVIDGQDICDLDLSAYRSLLSVVPQTSVLFEGSIRDNITYGLKKYSEKELLDAVERANINEFLKDLPDGLNSNVGEHGGKLSGGQKQRIAIARALIRNPRILILDEATSALDNISEYHVQKAIESVIKGRTTFIVAHRLSTIRSADRIVCMENGEIAEIGTYDELMALKGKFYELKRLSEVTTSLNEEVADDFTCEVAAGADGTAFGEGTANGENK